MGFSISLNSASKANQDSPMAQSVIWLAASIAKQGRLASLPDQPCLDVSFLLPGLYEKPPFTGMRMGGSSQDSGVIYFECAVPENLVESPRARDYALAVMADVIDNAAQYCTEQGQSFDARLWQDYVDDLPSAAD